MACTSPRPPPLLAPMFKNGIAPGPLPPSAAHEMATVRVTSQRKAIATRSLNALTDAEYSLGAPGLTGMQLAPDAVAVRLVSSWRIESQWSEILLLQSVPQRGAG